MLVPSDELTCANGVQPTLIDRDLMQLMKNAGFESISLGIESVNPKHLSFLKRPTGVKSIIQTVADLKSFGIRVTGYFIIGFPEETQKDIETLINQAHNLGLDHAHFSILSPISGSELESSWPVLSKKILPMNILKRLRRKAYRKFFFCIFVPSNKLIIKNYVI